MPKKVSVVTWADAPGGLETKICQTCDANMRQLGKWLKTWSGQSYSVHVKGAHLGFCDHMMHGKPFKTWTDKE